MFKAKSQKMAYKQSDLLTGHITFGLILTFFFKYILVCNFFFNVFYMIYMYSNLQFYELLSLMFLY